MTIDELKVKRIGVVGLGVNNQELVPWLLRHGVLDLTICDQNPAIRLDQPSWAKQVRWRLGADYLDHLTDFELLIRTPGIPYLSAPIQQAKAAGVIISSQTKLFFALAPARIVGVTGTKGKGTTASLIFEMLKHEKSRKFGKVYLAGNIGKDPFEFLDELTVDDWVVLELSSFQLQDMEQSPDVAVVLDITNDHINPHQHQDRAEYVRAKSMIITHQNTGQIAILNYDSVTSRELVRLTQGEIWYFSRRDEISRGSFVRWFKSASLRRGTVILRDQKHADKIVLRTNELHLRGEHNLENVTAAVTAAAVIGVSVSTMRQTLKNYRGLSHRLELVAEAEGRKFYDDSFATNPEPVIAAIKSFHEPIHLIVGGSSKAADFRELGRMIAQESSVVTLIPLGNHESLKIVDAVLIAQRKDSELTIMPSVQSMAEAVEMAFRLSKVGDAILLSPGAASFDLFPDYKERGNAFRHAALRVLGRLGR